MLENGSRVHQIDKRFGADESHASYRNQLFVRLVAKARRFTEVDFTYSIFDTCYLRNCVFESCDFTGCRFVRTNLHGSTFDGCKFDYASFEQTLIDSAVLDSACPPYENLKVRFARSLRANFQQTGDAVGANKAISVELAATEMHLRKTWSSRESYYRHKYRGLNRAKFFVRWLSFRILDLVWGNGERLGRLVGSVVAFLILMVVLRLTAFSSPIHIGIGQAVLQAPQVFLGVFTDDNLPSWYIAIVATLRLVAFGLFVAVITRRLSRR